MISERIRDKFAVSRRRGMWMVGYPAEQARIVQLLVERITVSTDGIAVDLRKEGLGLVLRDMLLPAKEEAFA